VVGNIVLERGQLNRFCICSFRFGQLQRHSSDPVDVKPIVTGYLSLKTGSDLSLNLTDQFRHNLIVHMNRRKVVGLMKMRPLPDKMDVFISGYQIKSRYLRP
jgi:hypothetical protein